MNILKCLRGGIVILFFYSSLLYSANWKTEREHLLHSYSYEKFRIFYDVDGKNALPDRKLKDTNRNNVPDYVEQLSLKLQQAADCYTDKLSFLNPLESPRYFGIARFIDVHLLAMQNQGDAGDAAIDFRYKSILQNNDKALTISLSVSLNENNLTPEHELFHLYQNGYSMFKNRWYTEGLARWAEDAFNKTRVLDRKPLPATKSELDAVLNQTYEAKYLWRQLAYLLDDTNKHNKLTCSLNSNINGNNIGGNNIDGLKESYIYGYRFVRYLLEKLDALDEIAAVNYKIPSHTWRETQQKSAENNIYLLCGLADAINLSYKDKAQISEIDSFLELIHDVTKGRCISLFEHK